MRTVLMAAAMVLAVAGLAQAGEKPRWVKFDTALAQAEQTGTPVAVYAVVTADGGGC